VAVTKAECGCRANEREWLAMCQPHAAEHQERHLRAAKEKARAELIGWYSMPAHTPDQPKQE
jgi:hypothetical protein